MVKEDNYFTAFKLFHLVFSIRLKRLLDFFNIFMKSSMMYFVISILGVLIFVGLTAYDTQKIKNMYLVSDSGELMGKKAVMGALTLYLDFINLFIMLLRLFGQRR